MFITMLIFSIVSVACFVEWYKKGLRGVKCTDGTYTTKATKIEIYCVAGVLSCVWGVVLHVIEPYGFITYIAYTFLVYSLQYFVDMKIIKLAVNEMIKNKLK